MKTEIGIRIREGRKAAGLLQQELGDLVGLAGSTISNYECGHGDKRVLGERSLERVKLMEKALNHKILPPYPINPDISTDIKFETTPAPPVKISLPEGQSAIIETPVSLIRITKKGELEFRMKENYGNQNKEEEMPEQMPTMEQFAEEQDKMNNPEPLTEEQQEYVDDLVAASEALVEYCVWSPGYRAVRDLSPTKEVAASKYRDTIDQAVNRTIYVVESKYIAEFETISHPGVKEVHRDRELNRI